MVHMNKRLLRQLLLFVTAGDSSVRALQTSTRRDRIPNYAKPTEASRAKRRDKHNAIGSKDTPSSRHSFGTPVHYSLPRSAIPSPTRRPANTGLRSSPPRIDSRGSSLRGSKNSDGSIPRTPQAEAPRRQKEQEEQDRLNLKRQREAVLASQQRQEQRRQADKQRERDLALKREEEKRNKARPNLDQAALEPRQSQAARAREAEQRERGVAREHDGEESKKTLERQQRSQEQEAKAKAEPQDREEEERVRNADEATDLKTAPARQPILNSKPSSPRRTIKRQVDSEEEGSCC
ncbi:unnamed protein product [Amoebophrya sp. A25]|nr:unnamed protein product [Amoebophrya sp. A25]|eukprot:GSA25T00011446001.1